MAKVNTPTTTDSPRNEGQSIIVTVDHTGPTSYPTGGETIQASDFQALGIPGGVHFVDVSGSISGTYVVWVIFPAAGETKTFKLKWFTGNGSTEVNNGTNLSGEVVRLRIEGR